MSKVSLTDATSLTNETTFISTLNANYASIKTASDNTLSRDGTSPNSMGHDFDMNSYQILNIGDLDMNGKRITGLNAAVATNEPVTLSQLEGVLGLTLNAPFTTAVEYVVDGAGTALTTGDKGCLRIPFACTINDVMLIADTSGSIVMNIHKVAYASYTAGFTGSICASAKPTITSTVKSLDTTLTGWTTAVAVNDILRFNIDSVSTITRILIALKVTKL